MLPEKQYKKWKARRDEEFKKFVKELQIIIEKV